MLVARQSIRLPYQQYYRSPQATRGESQWFFKELLRIGVAIGMLGQLSGVILSANG